MMVQWRHLQDAPTLAIFLLRELEPADLQHDRQRFRNKDAAHDGKHDFLAHDDGNRAQRGAKRQRAHIAHKDLRRVRVEPQEGQARASHRRSEDQHFSGTGDVREEQVFRVNRTARDVGKDAQAGAHHHHRHDGQTVQTVGQVDRIAGAHNHQVSQNDKSQHAQRVADFLDEGQQQTGLGRQVQVKARLHPFEKELQHAPVGILRDAEHQVQRRQQTNHGLPEIFFARPHALRVLVHHLAPVVGPADGAKAQRDEQNNPDKAVAQIGPQQRGDGNAKQDQHAAHGRRATLDQMRGHAVTANRLSDLEFGQTANDKRAGHQADQQRRQGRHDSAKGQVLKDAKVPKFGRQRLQPLGEAKQHLFLPCP